MTSAVPLTPRKGNGDEINLKINTVVSSLSYEWDLQLEVPKPWDSPSSRRLQTLPQKCVFKIKGLTFKNAIDTVLADFYYQADILYSRWVHKPKGERGTVPEKTRHKPRPVSDKERVELQTLFYQIADREFAQIMIQERGSPLSKRRTLRSDDINVSIRELGSSASAPPVDDTPIHNSFFSSNRRTSLKRAAEAVHEEFNTFKRTPRLDSKLGQEAPSDASFAAIANSNREINQPEESRKDRSANTSFASAVPSVFDRNSFNRSTTSLDVFFTQTTDHDDRDLDVQYQPVLKANSTEQSNGSEYEGGSSFDAELAKMAESFNGPEMNRLETGSIRTALDEDLCQGQMGIGLKCDEPDSKEGKLRECLEGIFPVMPDCLLSTPLHVRYEILRIFLYTGAALDSLILPADPKWDNYDFVWSFLRGLPVLKSRTFPERSSKEAWAACHDEFRRGSRGVTMSGSLRYRDSASTGPLFRFQLEPLRLEQTYRLRRRFGNDRFLELDVPNLTGRRVPKILRDCPDGKSIVIEWLFHDAHPIFGRFWVPFCTRQKEGKERKADSIQQSDTDSGVAHRLYFFAVHGVGFGDNEGAPNNLETVETRTAMSVEELLNWIRPTWENREQSYLKLFARTQLALSRNTPTVVLSRSQIRYRCDLRYNNEIMTDGAGRLSSALALKIVNILGLSHLPSGFQGRIGDAKGLWSIDPCYHGIDEWIEIYDSQRKWKRSGESIDDSAYKDPAHRIFEVNKWSGKLKSADLNYQLLPILVDRARSSSEMRQTIEKLVEDDLTRRVESQRMAMENPLLFRKWVRDSNPRLADRVKHGAVPFVAAMPDSTEEKLNMFLDAGFDPLKLKYLNDLSQTYYKQKCEELKKQLHITVPRSTYAYMVPDFFGVLEANEIYVHFSESFVDELSPLSGCPLKDMDVLVARSPAHFASDVQRVKAVVKSELLGLKDVIVFPTKGSPSLANKLSGGDYDGDLAWVCWEPSLVENFNNAEVPQCPDLVKEGFILKDRTTYEELAKGEANPTMSFLRRSFEFNLENSMLGICTNFKENLCYTQQRIDSKEAVYLSTLLSNLVDSAKQGYAFTEMQWDYFRKTLIKEIPRQPLYRTGDRDSKAEYIIDRLMFVADRTIDQILINFHKNMPTLEWWDPDLAEYSGWAYKEAERSPEWLRILEKLKVDINQVETIWKQQHSQEGSKTEEPFSSTLWKCYERFLAIQPEVDTPLTRALLEPWHAHPEVSRWALLRASHTFATYSKNYVAGFVWWMAGIQLCHLKAMKMGGVVSTVPLMYAMLKPDNTFVKLRLSEETLYQWEDVGAAEAAD